MFCINLAALFPAVHMSWFVPCGTVISKFVPFIVYVPSPIGLMNVHIGFIVHVLKSSDMMFDCVVFVEFDCMNVAVMVLSESITMLVGLLFPVAAPVHSENE